MLRLPAAAQLTHLLDPAAAISTHLERFGFPL